MRPASQRSFTRKGTRVIQALESPLHCFGDLLIPCRSLADEISRVPPSHHAARGFHNPSPQGALRGIGAMLRWAWQRARTRGLFTASSGRPPASVAHAVRAPRAASGECAITWIGHSTFLIQAGLIIELFLLVRGWKFIPTLIMTQHLMQ